MEISEEKSAQWNKLGLVQGPNESDDEYVRRADYCLHLVETLPKEHGEFIPGQVMERADTPLAEEAWQKTRELFDFAPLWAPLFFSNHQLAPWHGGCAWIFQTTESSPLGALFQLRRRFKDHVSFLGLYRREVLLAHEAVHVARMAFQEPKFEELIAYRTSDSGFQKCCGALVETSKEAAVFVLTLFLVVVVNLAGIGMGAIPTWILWLNAIPFAMAIAALVRLYIRQNQYMRCIKVLGAISAKPEAIACRLSDNEIIEFGKRDPVELKQWIKEQKSLRWRAVAQWCSDT